MALQTRPPIITIMGHVDHGKTTLLDYIRKTNVTAREAGGITQHIGAYQVEHAGKKLTFIDTPGHAAFNKMRQRGARVTDIVVLVVAANDGVKPQTIESIRYIKESNASIIVVVNKIDLPDVYPDMAKGQLAEHGVVVTDLGGDVEVVELSAKTGKNVDKLLETISVVAELKDLKADPDAPLQAVVIESALDSRRGPVATVIVQQGTLRVRQDIVTDDGEVEGRVRALNDEQGHQLADITPGSPAEIIGLKSVPDVGAIVRDLNAEYVEEETEEAAPAAADPYAGWNFEAAIANEGKEKLKFIVKADVQGTLEAILQNFDEESTEVIHSGVGEVSESDVETANSTGARIIAFHTKVPKNTDQLAKLQGVKIKQYDIIYKLIEDLQKQMLKLMEPTIDEVKTGEAEVLQIFEMHGQRIAGARVITGEIKKTDKLHIVRNDVIVGDPQITAMQRGKEEIDSAKAKSEFGITFRQKKSDVQVGDKLVAYHNEDE